MIDALIDNVVRSGHAALFESYLPNITAINRRVASTFAGADVLFNLRAVARARVIDRSTLAAAPGSD